MKQPNSFSPSVIEKIDLFRSLFTGLTHVHGIRDPKSNRQFQVKQPVTDQVLIDHLKGKRHYGVYLLDRDQTKAVVADFDNPDPMPVIAYFNTANHYGLPVGIETSKSKGFHVWIFFVPDAVSARKARLVAKHILEEIECPDVEIFPKQDNLDKRRTSGNYILAPLFGDLVLRGKTVFVDPVDLNPYKDQMAFLSGIKRADESVLDDIIETNQLTDRMLAPQPKNAKPNISPNVFGLPVCAQKMLKEGVSRYQRVSCFRLAVHLKRIGLSQDMTLAVLGLWANFNKPVSNKDQISEQEIQKQTRYAYSKSYRGYGCQSEAVRPYCQDSCKLRKGRNP